MRYGYKASAEQFGPRQLLDFAVLAEKLGLDSVAVSDHFQPWRHTTGRAPNALVWLGAVGAMTERILMGTSVLTPTLRYHPSIVAQVFGTLGDLYPDRVFLGVGTGEALNEIPATGNVWPGFKERRDRLVEAIELKRLLWAAERVSYEGRYYQTDRATIYDKPIEPIPIFVAAGGPQMAKTVGQVGDGFICTSGKKPELYRQLIDALEEGAREAGRDPAAIERFIEIKVSYDRDRQFAHDACAWWAALALTAEEKLGVEDPVEMERLADLAIDRAHTRFIVSDDPDEVVERIAPYVELGFTHLSFHAPGADQPRFLEAFCADVLPRLRARFG